jgi:dolichyl-phosphate beta-glucosyltransferase
MTLERAVTAAAPRPSLTLVIPAYNEEATLEPTLAASVAQFRDYPAAWEVVLVDDGSADRTRAIAEAFAASNPGVRVLSIRHGGKAAALRAGMAGATGEVILFSDADLATPLTYLDRFLDEIAAGADVVIATREGHGSSRIGEPWHRHVMGRVFNWLVQALLLPGIEDTQCGFKMFTREISQAILHNARLYRDDEEVTGARVTAFDVEMLVIARRQRAKIVAVPVVWTYGVRSKVSPLRDTLTNLRDVLSVKRNDLLHKYR